MSNKLDIKIVDPWKKMTVLGINAFADPAVSTIKWNRVETQGWVSKTVGQAYVNGQLYLVSKEPQGLILYDGKTRLPFWTLPIEQIVVLAKATLQDQLENPDEKHLLIQRIFANTWLTMAGRGITQDKLDQNLQQLLDDVVKKYGQRPQD